MQFHASLLYGYRTGAPIAKAVSDEQMRIERLVQRLERSVKRAFLDFVRAVQSPDVLRDVAEMLGRGDVEGALQIVDRYVSRMAPVVSDVFITAGRDEVTALVDQVKHWAPSTGISFDPTNERAAALMRNAQLQFIREMTQSQRDSIRQAITQGLMDGAGPRDMAREFRNAIGLTASQEAAVRNYERLLRTGSREALERDLRDRRYDRTIERADRTGEPLSPEQIERMTERYRQRYIAYRSETIARTETTRVVSQARQEALQQTIDEVGIDESLVQRVWRATKDHRVRHTHRSMDGQEVGKDDPFTSPSGAKLRYPGDPEAPSFETIMCRCVVINRIKRRSEVEPAPAAPQLDYALLDSQSREAVLDKGRRDGREHLAGYNRKTGEPVAQIEGESSSSVSFTPELVQQLSDPEGEYILHHNHPRSSSLSGQDLLMLDQFPGLHTVFAHGHDGSLYAATNPRGLTREIIHDVSQRVRGQLQRLVNQRIISPQAAGQVHAHLINEALRRQGRMEYRFELQGGTANAYIEVQNMVEDILTEVLKA